MASNAGNHRSRVPDRPPIDEDSSGEEIGPEPAQGREPANFGEPPARRPRMESPKESGEEMQSRTPEIVISTSPISLFEILRGNRARMTPATRRLLALFHDRNRADLVDRADRREGLVQRRKLEHGGAGLFASRPFDAGSIVMPPLGVHVCLPCECDRDELGRLLPHVLLFNQLIRDRFELMSSSTVRGDTNPPAKRQRLMDRRHRDQRRRWFPQRMESTESQSRRANTSAFGPYMLCLDFTYASTEAQSIRRSCASNCALQYVIHQHRINFVLHSTRIIRRGEELTLDHDQDYYYALTPIRCACERSNCEIERLRRRRMELDRLEKARENAGDVSSELSDQDEGSPFSEENYGNDKEIYFNPANDDDSSDGVGDDQGPGGSAAAMAM